MVMVNLSCSSFAVQNYEFSQEQPSYAYSMVLLASNEEDRDYQRKIISLDGADEG